MRLWTYRVLKCHECDVITMGQGGLKYATSPWRPTLMLRDTALHCGWAVTSQARLLERHTSQKRMVGPGGPGQGRASSAIMEALSSLLGHQLPNTGPLRAPPQPEDRSLQPPGPGVPATSLSVPTSTPPPKPPGPACSVDPPSPRSVTSCSRSVTFRCVWHPLWKEWGLGGQCVPGSQESGRSAGQGCPGRGWGPSGREEHS